MKIVTIFEDQLFVFHYKDEEENEFRRLLKQWNDTTYLYQFIIQNKIDIPKGVSIQNLISELIENANDIDDILYEISTNTKKILEEFFKPLDNQEYRIVELSKQKGRKNYLRLYAIRIDENCFILTGGTIKFHHLNKDRWHTQKEMDKINKCRDFLKDNSVFDADSYYEFINEQ
ncbi:hypothetical protein ERX46_10205 [Brumimicrobium glaciale]|uniref:Uncharacterized protein n=1 Tax=Brumimicrobium glaciale TaxID=200475 RepID=A0A4Q4KKR2_9FLAO|nr:hypothetical protein [Brumimicrobium glaciale]RYM33307.1 hypothetical protein ERX46_10205 [Brumimicrobium glaciale]